MIGGIDLRAAIVVIEEEIRSLSNVELAHTPVQPCKLGPKLSRVSHIGIGTKISIIVTLKDT